MVVKESVSVIIPTVNSPHISACVKAVLDQSANAIIKEIIVVGQEERSAILSDEKVKYIQVQDNPTPATNRNIGARNATGDWFVFTDSDCIPDLEWIASLMKMASSTSPILGGAVRQPIDSTYWAICDHLLAFKPFAAELNFGKRLLKYAATLNFAVTKEVFHAAGGFDETYEEPAGEDMELGARLRGLGFSILYCPSAMVTHLHSRTQFRTAWDHLYRFGNGFVKYRDQHPVKYWNIWRGVIRTPLLGEVVGLSRVISRAFIRLFQNPKPMKYIRYLPGVLLLDLAHSLGMIAAIRG
jgi:glycosyltransferase involved in cell wall biosynthesis